MSAEKLFGVGVAHALYLIAQSQARRMRQARKLVIGEKLRQKGYVCKGHQFLSLEETGCTVCGAKLLPVESIVNEIIEIAYLHGVSMMVVEHRQDLLSRYDGIAAVTYPHSPHA